MDNISLTINGETRSLIDTLNYLDDTDASFTFTDLNDTPPDYTGQGGKLIAVKTTEDGTEFIDAPSGDNPSGDNLVDSVFGRVGSVVAQAGDYTADDITETVASKIMTAAERTKLSGIEAGATGDQSDAEIEVAYNNRVGQVSAGEISAGTGTGVRRFSPKNIADVARAHGGGGMVYTDIHLPVPAFADPASPPKYEYVNGLPLQLFDEGNSVKWPLRMPEGFGPSPVLKVLVAMKTATSGTLSLSASVDAASAGDSQIISNEKYAAANTAEVAVPTTPETLTEVSIPLTSNDDLSAGDHVCIKLERAGGTASGGMHLLSAALTPAS